MKIPPRIVVAVLTYCRPDDLARILPLLLEQARTLVPAAEVVVVDNDPSAGAREFVATCSDHGARYVHEPEPGIAAARNRALEEARARDANALVFIDDDEEPQTGWLAELVDCWLRSGAAAVTGPVQPVFERSADRWVLASGRFARREHDTGALLRSASSNNLLLDLATLDRLGLRFDPSFGITGGEDTMLTHELVARGGRIVWSEGAVVLDHIPAHRMTRSWILRREFRSGTSYTRMRVCRTRGRARRVVVRADLAARGSMRIAAGLARWGWGTATRDVAHRARGTCLAAANAGLVSGAFGLRYYEYRR